MGRRRPAPTAAATLRRSLCLALLAASPPVPCEGNLLRGVPDPKTVREKSAADADADRAAAASPTPPPPPPPVAASTVPLHAADGTHHVYVYVGSPPQRRTLIVDTGSRLMAFPCVPCDGCGGHASPSYYDPGLSTTDVPSRCGECKFVGLSKCSLDGGGIRGADDGGGGGRCTFVQRYTEGSSLTAYEVEDLVWLGTDDADESVREHMDMAVPFCFGCQTSESGLFRTQYADGIVGLAMHPASVLRAFLDAGAIERDAFSLCLHRVGGSLSLGGTSPSVGPTGDALGGGAPRRLEPMRYTPLARDHGWYVVSVVSVSVGDSVVASDRSVLDGFNSGKGTIVDSGTTDTYLPRAAADPVRRAWADVAGRPYSNKMERYTAEEFRRLPAVTLTLEGGVVWSITPRSYMEPSKEKGGGGAGGEMSGTGGDWSGSRAFTNRMYLDEPNGCVLGGNAMLDHDILFDATGKVVGIARADCAYRGGGDGGGGGNQA